MSIPDNSNGNNDGRLDNSNHRQTMSNSAQLSAFVDGRDEMRQDDVKKSNHTISPTLREGMDRPAPDAPTMMLQSGVNGISCPNSGGEPISARTQQTRRKHQYILPRSCSKKSQDMEASLLSSPQQGASIGYSSNLDHGDDENLCESPDSTRVFFPARVYQMLEDAHSNGDSAIVSWTSGGDGFKVHNIPEFTKQILPKYFRQTLYKSFLRQLSTYGFQRIMSGQHRGTRLHKQFIRGKKEEACRIKPIVKTGQSKKQKKKKQQRQQKETGDSASTINNTEPDDSTIPMDDGDDDDDDGIDDRAGGVPMTVTINQAPAPAPAPVSSNPPSLLPLSKPSSEKPDAKRSATRDPDTVLKSHSSLLALSSLLQLSNTVSDEQAQAKIEASNVFHHHHHHHHHYLHQQQEDSSKDDALFFLDAFPSYLPSSMPTDNSVASFSAPPATTQEATTAEQPQPARVAPVQRYTVECVSPSLVCIHYTSTSPNASFKAIPMAPNHLNSAHYPLSPPVQKALDGLLAMKQSKRQ